MVRLFHARSCRRLFLLLAPLLLPVAARAAGHGAWPEARRVIHVSPEGRSGWSGDRSSPNRDSTDGPLPSLAAARDRLRTLRQTRSFAGPVEVWIHGGTYVLDAPFVLEAADSGTPGTPMTWRAAPGDHPRILGGPILPASAPAADGLVHVQVSPEVLRRARGSDDYRLGARRPVFEVFWNRRRLTLARWPNLPEGASPDQGWAYIRAAGKGARTEFTAPRLPAWMADEAADAEIHLFPSFNWFDQIMNVKTYDAATRRLSFTQPTAYDLARGARFYIQNTRGALDAPGEWWFDRTKGQLLIMPPDRATAADAEIVVSTLPTLLQATGVHDLTIEGLTWQNCTSTAVVIRDVNHFAFRHNIVGLTGAGAIDAKTDGSLRLEGNVLHSLGFGGMILEGGNRHTLTPSRIVASDNLVTHFGERLKCYKPAFKLAGVGVRILHNDIEYGPHEAIEFSGNDHLIAHNRIRSVCLDTEDAGAVYAGRDWSSRGTRIESNVFDHIPGWGLAPVNDAREQAVGPVTYRTGGGVHGVYLDDLLENVRVESNVFQDIQSAAIHLGGGSYFTIRDNVFTRCRSALLVGYRTSVSAPAATLERFAPNLPVYLRRYPTLKHRAGQDPLLPQSIVFTGNRLLGLESVYDLRRIATSNTFDHNRIAGMPARLDATLRSGGADRKITNWADWLAAGFDRHSRILPVPAAGDLNNLRRIEHRAGVRDRIVRDLAATLPAAPSTRPAPDSLRVVLGD